MGTKESTWNGDFSFHIKHPPTKPLQIAAWDANLVAPNKRMENAGVDLEWLCDGDAEIQYSTLQKLPSPGNGSALDEKKTDEMKKKISTAESAMEAWAMLATSLGQPSFIKSEFEKICFLDNATTDTQVSIWRDSAWKRQNGRT